MKIPKSIKINTSKFKVKVVDNLPSQIAEVQIASALIHIGNTCGEDRYEVSETNQAEGLLHEIIHVITVNNGYGIQEKLVTCIAHNLLAIIRDNKLDFLDTFDLRLEPKKKGKK